MVTRQTAEYLVVNTEIKSVTPTHTTVAVLVANPVLTVTIVIPAQELAVDSREVYPHIKAMNALVEGIFPHLKGKRFIYREYLTAHVAQFTCGSPRPVFVHFNVDNNAPSYSG